jgi:hypothetical protein
MHAPKLLKRFSLLGFEAAGTVPKSSPVKSDLAEQLEKCVKNRNWLQGFRILQSGRPARITRALDSIGF